MGRYVVALGALILIVAVSVIVDARLASTYQEVEEIAHLGGDFKELKNYFTNLSENKGAAYGYEVLRKATLPPDTDLHLLGHVVGEILYKERGIDGIQICTQEFRNACSHAIVTGAFYEFGEEALPKIESACQKAPGGLGAYGMCFHGLGHGILTYLSYDVVRAIEFCKKTGTGAHFNEEYKQCASGTIMEIVGGGDHDKELWSIERMKYLSTTDPLAPCNASWMPLEVRPMCYSYLTPNLFTFGGGNLGNLSEKNYRQAFSFCERIPQNEPQSRASCFGGIGKELPTIVMARDIRAIDQIPAPKLATVHEWCELGETTEAVGGCIRSVVQSLIWGGENDPYAAGVFCSLTPGGTSHEACIDELMNAASFYLTPDNPKRDRVCEPLSGEDATTCSSRLLSKT